MQKRTFRLGCIAAGVFFLILLLAGGGWWFLRAQQPVQGGAAPSPVFVFLVSPGQGDEVEAGDYLPVTIQAFAPVPIRRAELFVDGKSLGTVDDSPQDASWTWQPLQAGIHTLLARVETSDGQTGESQSIIVNVMSRDGPLQVAAKEGQTLEQVGADLGLPPGQMIEANPQIDPAEPLPGGFPVQLPAGENGPGSGSEGISPPQPVSQGTGYLPVSIAWQFQPAEPVEKSYCYVTGGGGVWEKIPKKPFVFFNGQPAKFVQVDQIPKGQAGAIQVQCWGWQGDVLKFLGQGETKFDVQQPPAELQIVGESFTLVGLPAIPVKEENFTGGGGKIIPPPFSVREPADAADCSGHSHPLLGGFVCNTLLNAPVKEHILLEWEWKPAFCWGSCPDTVDAIDGYRVYEIDPVTQNPKYLKEITNPAQRVTALPLPWGYRCYGVSAYVNDLQLGDSSMAIYCPGSPPAPQVTTLTPIYWLTTGGDWIQDGDCDTYGGLDSYLFVNQKEGFGNQPGEVLVGSSITDDEEEDCYREGTHSGAVKFPQPSLPPNAVIQKAILKFSTIFHDYYASGLATNYKFFCVRAVSKAKQDWTGLDQGNHFVGNDVLANVNYYTPIKSLPPGDTSPEVDVTPAIKTWLKHPEQNHGFVLNPASAPSPLNDGSGVCESGVGNFILEIQYFTP